MARVLAAGDALGAQRGLQVGQERLVEAQPEPRRRGAGARPFAREGQMLRPRAPATDAASTRGQQGARAGHQSAGRTTRARARALPADQPPAGPPRGSRACVTSA